MIEKNNFNILENNQEKDSPISPLQITGAGAEQEEFAYVYGSNALTQAVQISTKSKNKAIRNETKLNEKTLQEETIEIVSYANKNGQVAFETASNITPENVASMLNLTGDTNKIFVYIYALMLAKINGQNEIKKAKNENDIKTSFNLMIDEIAFVFGKKDKKEFRKTVKKTLLELRETDFSIPPMRNGVIDYNAEPAKLNIVGDIIPITGGYRVSLGPALSFMIAKNTGGVYPLSYLYFRISNNNPLAVRFVYKLNSHYTMRNNQMIGTNNIISVESLLKDIDETILPSYETVMKGNGAVNQRIIEPFYKALNTIEDESNQSFTWSFCHSGGVELTEEEEQNLNYSLLRTLYVKFEFDNLPLMSEEEKRKRVQIKEANRKAKAQGKAKRAGEIEAENEAKAKQKKIEQ